MGTSGLPFWRSVGNRAKTLSAGKAWLARGRSSTIVEEELKDGSTAG
jgi:hypothetical protein